MNQARTHVVQTAGSVPAISQTSILSNRIAFPFVLDRLSIVFPAGCSYLVRLYPYVSADDQVWTTTLPAGTNILSDLSPSPYVVGDNQEITLDPDLPFPQKGLWLRAHLRNDDAWSHQITVLWVIRELLLEAP